MWRKWKVQQLRYTTTQVCRKVVGSFRSWSCWSVTTGTVKSESALGTTQFYQTGSWGQEPRKPNPPVCHFMSSFCRQTNVTSGCKQALSRGLTSYGFNVSVQRSKNRRLSKASEQMVDCSSVVEQTQHGAGGKGPARPGPTRPSCPFPYSPPELFNRDEQQCPQLYRDTNRPEGKVNSVEDRIRRGRGFFDWSVKYNVSLLDRLNFTV